MSSHPAIVHWSEIEAPEPWHYDGHDEKMGINAAFGGYFCTVADRHSSSAFGAGGPHLFSACRKHRG